MIIDFHAHYLAQDHLNMHIRTPEGLTLGSSIHGQGKDATLEANGRSLGHACETEDFYDLTRRLEHMSESNVDIEVLSPPPYMSFTGLPAQEAAKLLREQNEAIAEVVHLHPDHFRGLGMVPFQDATTAVPEIIYLMDKLELLGVEVNTHIAGKNLDDPDLEPIWQTLDDLHAVVFIHPNDVLGAERMSRYYLTNLLGNPVETALAVASLAFGGIFTRFPRIRFIAAHGGGVAPFVLGRWEHGAHVRPELVMLTESPLALLRHIYMDSIVHGAPELLYLIDILGADRIVLGSDIPFDMGTRDSTSLFGAALPDDIRQCILANHQDLLQGIVGPSMLF